MKTAYAAGCLLTAEVAAGRRVAPRWQDWGPVFFPALPCIPAARAPAITPAFRAGRRRKELSRSPFIRKGAAFLGPPHRLHLCLFDQICSQGHFWLQGSLGRGGLGWVLGWSTMYDVFLSHTAQILFLSWGNSVSLFLLPLQSLITLRTVCSVTCLSLSLFICQEAWKCFSLMGKMCYGDVRIPSCSCISFAVSEPVRS